MNSQHRISSPPVNIAVAVFTDSSESLIAFRRLLLRVFLMTVLATSSNSLAAQDVLLKADEQFRWQRGNMHTHSYWSDGDDFPESIAKWYRDQGYQFLVFTDHNTLLQKERWVEISKIKAGEVSLKRLLADFPDDWVIRSEESGTLKVRLKTFDEIFEKLAVPQKYLLIQGEEITDKFGKRPVHMCATNTEEFLPPLGGDSVRDVIQRNIDAALARRERTGVSTLVHLNHPNFGYAVTAEDLMPVVGENFFEVYNGHPTVFNSGDAEHASTERMWDIINSFRLSALALPVLYGLATDDGHNYHEAGPGRGAQPGRGWVCVLTDKLTPDAIVESLEAGQFYSSSGVQLKAIEVRDGKLRVDVEPDQSGSTYRIDFIGTRRGFNTESFPMSDDPEKAAALTRRYSAEIGTLLKSVNGSSAEYQMDGTELYVRAVVTSSRRHPNPSEPGEFERAWVQPVIPRTAR